MTSLQLALLSNVFKVRVSIKTLQLSTQLRPLLRIPCPFAVVIS